MADPARPLLDRSAGDIPLTISAAELAELVRSDPAKFAQELLPEPPPPPEGAKPSKSRQYTTGRIGLRRQLAPVIVALWLQEYKWRDIARYCGCSVETVKHVIQAARRKHGVNDVMLRLHHEVVPNAMDVIAETVSNAKPKDAEERQAARDMAVKIASGVGLFKSYSDNKGGGGGGGVGTLALTINNVQVAAPDHPTTITGEIVGRPREDADA